MTRLTELRMAVSPGTRFKASAENGRLTLYLYGDVEEGTANRVAQALEEHKDASSVELYINSFGGYVDEGLTIYNLLNRLTVPVTCYVDGFACSIASVIAMVGRLIMPTNALLMVHNCWTFAAGNSAELRKTADDMDKMMDSIRQIYATKGGNKLTAEKLTELLDAETWLNAAECLELGLCDEVIGAEEDAPETRAEAEGPKTRGWFIKSKTKEGE